MEKRFKKLDALIKKSKTAVIVGHIRPDGDCVGSCIAVQLALQSLGYTQTHIYIDGDVPKIFSYMPQTESIKTEFDLDENAKKYDVMVTLDCADEGRLGVFSKLRYYAKKVICIDHHLKTTIEADVMISEPDKASVGVILYQYFISSNIKITKDIATALYTSIASDTGCFLFSSTNPLALRIAADLMEYGIDTETINYNNFRVYEKNSIPVLIHVLQNIKLFSDNN